MPPVWVLFAVAAILSTVGHAKIAPTRVTESPGSVTVPLVLEDNRVFVEFTFRRVDGSPRKARAWVDTGGGSLLITDGLSQELGLSRTGDEVEFEGRRAVPIAPPDLLLETFSLDLTGVRTFASLGAKRIAPGIDAEAFLPARVLRRCHVIFDYPARTFTLARPGVLTPRGQRVPASIHPESGFPRIELSVDGGSYGLLLDTGAAYTMISRELLDRWAAQHTDWPRLNGAVGEANMIGNQTNTDALLLRLPKAHWGAIELHDVGAVSRRVGIFETSMSRMMAAPIVGAIAGNVLKTLRVEIDYANGLAYIEQGRQPDANDLDSVGIIFQVVNDGRYRITGVARNGDRDVVEGVRAGDELVSVDGPIVTGASRDTVIRSLQGKPGDRHKLRLLRDGKEFELELIVQHLL